MNDYFLQNFARQRQVEIMAECRAIRLGQQKQSRMTCRIKHILCSFLHFGKNSIVNRALTRDERSST